MKSLLLGIVLKQKFIWKDLLQTRRQGPRGWLTWAQKKILNSCHNE